LDVAAIKLAPVDEIGPDLLDRSEEQANSRQAAAQLFHPEALQIEIKKS
jgi:hypothetical protein